MMLAENPKLLSETLINQSKEEHECEICGKKLPIGSTVIKVEQSLKGQRYTIFRCPYYTCDISDLLDYSGVEQW